MKKQILLTTVVVLVSACNPSPMIEAKAQYLCKDNGGVYAIRLTSQYPVKCNNGVNFDAGIVNKTIIKNPKYYPKKEN